MDQSSSYTSKQKHSGSALGVSSAIGCQPVRRGISGTRDLKVRRESVKRQLILEDRSSRAVLLVSRVKGSSSMDSQHFVPALETKDILTLPAVFTRNLYFLAASECLIYCIRGVACSTSTGAGSERRRIASSFKSRSSVGSSTNSGGAPRRVRRGTLWSKLRGGYSSMMMPKSCGQQLVVRDSWLSLVRNTYLDIQ